MTDPVKKKTRTEAANLKLERRGRKRPKTRCDGWNDCGLARTTVSWSRVKSVEAETARQEDLKTRATTDLEDQWRKQTNEDPKMTGLAEAAWILDQLKLIRRQGPSVSLGRCCGVMLM